MKIIVLSGPSNCGKTTTINAVFDSLCGGNRKASNVLFYNSPVGNPVQNDFEGVLDYKNKKIAFFSMGDYKRDCINAIVKYAGADVLIMAMNNYFTPILTDENVQVFNGFDSHVVFQSKDYFSQSWVQTIINSI